MVYFNAVAPGVVAFLFLLFTGLIPGEDAFRYFVGHIGGVATLAILLDSSGRP